MVFMLPLVQTFYELYRQVRAWKSVSLHPGRCGRLQVVFCYSTRLLLAHFRHVGHHSHLKPVSCVWLHRIKRKQLSLSLRPTVCNYNP